MRNVAQNTLVNISIKIVIKAKSGYICNRKSVRRLGIAAAIEHLHEKQKFTLYKNSKFGVWRSWLAHLHGVQGVGCSSHLTPTTFKRLAAMQAFLVKTNRNLIY